MKSHARTGNKELVIGYNKRIVAFGRERKLAEARACLDELRGRGLAPSEVTFNVLINASIKCGDNGGAAGLLADMQAQGLQPNVVTFTTVVKGLCLSGELERAEQMLRRAEQQGVVPNLRTCSAFLRGCLVWGEVDRVLPLIESMRRRWHLALDGPSAEYACRALCMALRVDEAEGLLKPAPPPPPPARPRPQLARRTDSAMAAAAPEETSATHLAFAVAHSALLDLDGAERRLELAQARLADGSETQLFGDREEAHGEQLAAFLQHRRNELLIEMDRARAFVTAQRKVAGGCDEGGDDATPSARRLALTGPAVEQPAVGVEQPAVGEARGAKRQRVAERGAERVAERVAGAAPTKRTLRSHLRAMEGVYARVLLVSESTARLAQAPLDDRPAYGKAPKPLRRLRFGALLVARLERLGLAALQQRCTNSSASAVAKSEKRMIKRCKRACNAACHIRWPAVFGNSAPTCIEVCAGGGEWAFAHAAAAPSVNWVAAEIRGDRVHQIFDRMRTSGLTNVACLGGDAALALRHHTRPNAFDAVFVTFPEPPADHGDVDAYLLNAAFFRDAFAALTPGGRGLLIVTDNLSLLDGVSETLYRVWDAQAMPYVVRSGADAGQRPVVGARSVGGRALISEGVPSGFGDGGSSSYFDRLWASRAKERRFHVAVTKPE